MVICYVSGMVWSAEDLASLSDGKKKKWFRKTYGHIWAERCSNLFPVFSFSEIFIFFIGRYFYTVGKKVSLNQYANYLRIQKSKYLVGVVFAFENFKCVLICKSCVVINIYTNTLLFFLFIRHATAPFNNCVKADKDMVLFFFRSFQYIR